jgi:hypothetical protein
MTGSGCPSPGSPDGIEQSDIGAVHRPACRRWQSTREPVSDDVTFV